MTKAIHSSLRGHRARAGLSLALAATLLAAPFTSRSAAASTVRVKELVDVQVHHLIDYLRGCLVAV